MTQDVVAPAGAGSLSQPARVVDAFIAPTKTFTDILRSASCWLPILLLFLITAGWAAAIDRSVGFAAASEIQVAKNPKAEAQLQELPPDQRSQRIALTAKFTRISTYASGIFALIFWLLEALALWGAFNFGLGAALRFSQVFAVITFAALPRMLTWLLSAVLLLAGVGHDSFDMRNPVGTNLGFYLQDSPKWLSTAGSFFDVLGLWSLALLVLGMAIVSRKKITQSAVIIVSLWFLVLVVVTGVAAATS